MSEQPRPPERGDGDARKREALVSLRESYGEVRGLVASGKPHHANLEWILGARRNPTQDPLGFDTRTIRLVALWLQDLANDLDARLSQPPAPESAPVSPSRESVALRLREATEAFVVAFRR